jgi:hypothetical protein
MADAEKRASEKVKRQKFVPENLHIEVKAIGESN